MCLLILSNINMTITNTAAMKMNPAQVLANTPDVEYFLTKNPIPFCTPLISAKTSMTNELLSEFVNPAKMAGDAAVKTNYI